MPDISLCFEVHQPLRLKKSFFWERSSFRKVEAGKLFDFYFDDQVNRRIFERISDKCYLPANKILLEEINRLKETDRPFKVAFSLSGIFVDQCRRYKPEVLDSFVRLVDTGHVELLEQTYYHSLTSLYPEKEEFLEQIKMHRELVWEVFGQRPEVFENTELLYNDDVAKVVEGLGFRGIFAEGIVANPNYVYKPEGCTDLALLFRNYSLTDDVGFRFSSRGWEEYPLDADKYAAWLAATPGQCINIFCDYETFGEHHWPETGILEFLRYLPRKILERSNLQFATPSEVVKRHGSVGVIGVKDTISWADMERDTSCWTGNALQWACFVYVRDLEGPVKESEDPELMDIWRCLGLSDHLYYLFTWGGGPGEVHSYFSPYNNPYDAAVTYLTALSDFHFRVKERSSPAEDPFLFSTGVDQFTGEKAWSEKGLFKVLSKVSIKSIEFHMKRGDLMRWARSSLHNNRLADRLEEIEGLKGEPLRGALLEIVKGELMEHAFKGEVDLHETVRFESDSR